MNIVSSYNHQNLAKLAIRKVTRVQIARLRFIYISMNKITRKHSCQISSGNLRYFACLRRKCTSSRMTESRAISFKPRQEVMLMRPFSYVVLYMRLLLRCILIFERLSCVFLFAKRTRVLHATPTTYSEEKHIRP